MKKRIPCLGLCVLLFLSLICLSAAKGQANAEWEWQKEYAKCVDSNYELVPSKVAYLKAYLPDVTHRYPDDAAILVLWANLTAHTGDWHNAEEANTRLLQLKTTYEQSQTARANLAGVAAIQGKYGTASMYFLSYVLLMFRNTGLPALCVCLIWGLLEIVMRKEGQKQSYSRHEIRNLLLLACLPLLFFLFWEVARLLNSLFFFGNVGAALVSYKADAAVGVAVSIEWALMSLYLAYRIKKFWIDKSSLTQEELPVAQPNNSKSLAFLKSFAVIVCGVILLDLYTPSFIGRFRNATPEIYTYIVKTPHTWVSVLALLDIIVLSPIAQEVFFRGAVLQYLKSVAGRGTGFLFGSVLFAGLHGSQAGQFATLVFVGLVFSVQAEVTARLEVPIITHSITNLLLALLSKVS